MRIIEGEYGDRPLPGPWSRPGGGRRGHGGSDPGRPPDPVAEGAPGGGGIPGSEGSPGNEGDFRDIPLPGPWSRRREPGPADPGPVAADSAPVPEAARGGRDGDLPAAARTQKPQPPRPVEDLGPAGVPGTGEPRKEFEDPSRECRRSQPGGLHVLFTPRGIYSAVIMAEILGSRGGRRGRR